jgi:CDP-glucose 4,6-dehydratase
MVMALPVMFADIYSGKRVLVTGHTGFKGSWLAFWLTRLGAQVFGLALPPDTRPSHFQLLDLPIQSMIADIRDPQALDKAIQEVQPDIIFHLAAQPLVRRSYREPVETFATNVMGTIHLFEACRKVDTVQAIVTITSDKCYENKEWVWGYRETDPMGGFDPYSASKGCAELVTASWRRSYFHPDQYGRTHHTLVATARAGNVIGGGDWGEDRLIPDIARATADHRPVIIRNPAATRPWQHVLDPLSGYLLLGQKLLEGEKDHADAYNFGPARENSMAVAQVVRQFKTHWDAMAYEFKPDKDQPHEAGLLQLDCAKANSLLNWHPVWDSGRALEKTAVWYKNYYSKNNILTHQDFEDYIITAHEKKMCWITDPNSQTAETRHQPDSSHNKSTEMMQLQEKSGFVKTVLGDEAEDVWNEKDKTGQ